MRMRHAITFFANACSEYNFGGFRILTDPWLTDGAFYGSWYHDPPIDVWPRTPDLIYVSHIHPDHYDPETLRSWPDVPIVTLQTDGAFLERAIRRDGLKNEILSLPPGQSLTIDKDITLTIFGPFVKHPFHECMVGNIIDSALVVECDGTVIVNTNDNTPDLDSARMLKTRWPSITVAQLNYNAAGPYPVSFSNLTEQEKIDRAGDVLSRNLRHMTAVAEILDAHYTMPFAGEFRAQYPDYLLGITDNAEAGRHVRHPLVLRRGETKTLRQGPPYRHRMTFHDYHSDVTEDKLERARSNFMAACCRYAYTPSARVTINEFELCKGERELACTLDERLLAMILDRKAHWNNAEIGFHINFHRTPDHYDPDLHMMLSFFHA